MAQGLFESIAFTTGGFNRNVNIDGVSFYDNQYGTIEHRSEYGIDIDYDWDRSYRL